MRTVELKRIAVLSAIVRGGIICSMAGFVLGLVFAFWIALFTSTFTLATGIDVTGAGYTMLILGPVAGMIGCGLSGTGLVLILVILYNVTAGFFGGVRVSVNDEQYNHGYTSRHVENPDEQLPPPSVGYPF